MGGVLCSALVSEWLKNEEISRSSFLTEYIPGFEVNDNVINIPKLVGVSTRFVILYYFLL